MSLHTYRGVAQLVERVVRDGEAVGSNPTTPTHTIKSPHRKVTSKEKALLLSFGFPKTQDVAKTDDKNDGGSFWRNFGE